MSKVQKIPNLFIVGAAKAGTTSLYHYLKEHPNVYFSPVKEPHHFSSDIIVDEFCTAYRKNTYLDADGYFANQPLEDVQTLFVRNHKQYLSLFDACEQQQIIGECSTSYLYSNVAAKRLFDFNPKAKIVIILRNPISRAYSHYQMALRYGHTKLSFRKALEKDMHHSDKGWGKSELFLELSQYAAQVQRYFDVFPSAQIKVLLLDDLKNDGQAVMDELYEFLEISSIAVDAETRFNEAVLPKFKGLNSFIARTGIREAIKKVFSDSVTGKLKNVFYQHGNLPKLSADDKRLLVTLLKDDVDELSVLLKRDLSFWLA